MKSIIGVIALPLLAGCREQAEQNLSAANESAATPSTTVRTNESASVAPREERTPLTEPKGPIDPKSVEAAGQVVQHYGALIEQDRWAEAGNSWGDADAAAAFAKQLQSRRLNHLEIGKLGQPEGAAGSIYVTMPVVFYNGASRSAADVILRRVNDVPGSTDAQRRWHIERIEWKV